MGGDHGLLRRSRRISRNRKHLHRRCRWRHSLGEKVEAEPAAIIAALKQFGQAFKRIGLEAGPTSSWLYSELHRSGYPAICLECRHVKAGLSAMRNKTDRNDARGIAQLVRL